MRPFICGQSLIKSISHLFGLNLQMKAETLVLKRLSLAPKSFTSGYTHCSSVPLSSNILFSHLSPKIAFYFKLDLTIGRLLWAEPCPNGWNSGRTPQMHKSKELKWRDASVAKQTTTKTSRKKKAAFQTQGLPKTLPFPLPHKMCQKGSDNKACLTQI